MQLTPIERADEAKDALAHLQQVLAGSIAELAEEVKGRIQKDIETNWRIKDYPKALKDELERLAASTTEKDQHEFRGKLGDLVAESYKEANTKFEALFGFPLA